MITVKLKPSFMYGNRVVLVLQKRIDVRIELSKLKFEEKLKSYDSGEKISFVSEKRKSCASLSDDHPCTEEASVLTFMKLRSRVA